MTSEEFCSDLPKKAEKPAKKTVLLSSGEKPLRKSEQYFNEVLQHSRDVILRRSFKTGDFAYISEATEQISGISSTDMKNMSIDEFFALVHPDDRKRLKDTLASAFLDPQQTVPITVEYRLRRKDGAYAWLNESLTIVRDQEGVPDFAISNVRDITREKKAVKELRQKEAQYREIFNATIDGLIIFDLKGNVVEVNPCACRLFGYSRSEFLTMQGKDLVHPAYYRDHNGFLESIEEQGEFYGESVNVQKDGTCFNVEAKGIEFDYRGKKHLLAIVKDVTDRKRTAKRIKDLTRQLITAQENERRRLSRDLHDNIAQTLSALKLECEVLFDNDDDSWVDHSAPLMEKLDRTIAEVRHLASDLRPPMLDELGLVKTVSQYCDEFSHTYSIDVDFFSAGVDNITLHSDIEINLFRLIQEALNNIAKHAHASLVTVRMVASFPTIILRIEDNGKGFDVKKRTKAALDEKRMGIKNMEERVSLVDGTIQLRSRLALGTKLYIEIPVRTKGA